MFMLLETGEIFPALDLCRDLNLFTQSMGTKKASHDMNPYILRQRHGRLWLRSAGPCVLRQDTSCKTPLTTSPAVNDCDMETRGN